jgi:hypothetical protein
VRNLYAYRATDPSELACVDDPIGPINGAHLAHDDANRTIVAWGSNPAAVSWPAGNPRTVITRRHPLYCLEINDNGSPKHPLYVHSTCQPIRWDRTPTPQHRHGGHRD